MKDPIVLAHGLFGFSDLGLERYRLVPYFRKIPGFLESAGNTVVITSVPPTRSIVARAQVLKEEIHKHLGKHPFHLIAHSMGGLDARHMITHLRMEQQALTLTSIGTPHRGTFLADLVVDKVERTRLVRWLARLGIPLEAFYDLRTGACQEFNDQTPNSTEVRYFSVVGVKERAEMLPPLRFTADLITPIEGPNDGLVSQSSAEWGEAVTVWDCDHVNQIGWTGPFEHRKRNGFDVVQGYSRLVDQLRAYGY